MYLFKSLPEFKFKFEGEKKWDRLFSSLNETNKMRDNIFYNNTDSLIIMKTNLNMSGSKFEGHKRYMDIYYILEGESEIEINLKKNLELYKQYEDITYTEYYTWKGEKINLKKGCILVAEINEAIKFLKDENTQKIVVKLTVE